LDASSLRVGKGDGGSENESISSSEDREDCRMENPSSGRVTCGKGAGRVIESTPRVGEGDSGGREKSMLSSDTSKGIWIDDASSITVSDSIGRENASGLGVGEGNGGSEKDSISREDAASSVIDNAFGSGIDDASGPSISSDKGMGRENASSPRVGNANSDDNNDCGGGMEKGSDTSSGDGDQSGRLKGLLEN
jgi:hypothetical protein